MFATLLSPADASPTQEGRIAAVAALGGPYFTTNGEDLAAARAAGLQGAMVVADTGSPDLIARISEAMQTEAEIIAIRTNALALSAVDRAAQIARLAAALAACEGRHRMLICVDAPLAPIDGPEWGALPAESLLIDPIADPDAWRAAANLPGDRGLVLALVGSAGDRIEAREVLLWALQYAAALGGRGGERVGFTERPARERGGSADPIRSEVAEKTHRALLDLLRLTSADAETLRRELDPRSISPAAVRLASRKRN